MANPIKTIMDIKREELPLSLLMFSYFFLVITSFWILKPLKKTLFIRYYDAAGFTLFSSHMKAAQAELFAKVLNMVVAFLAVVVFTWLARNFRRQKLSYIFCVFFMGGYVIYSFLVNTPEDITVWTFYLYGDLFNSLMLATFFAFLNDSVTAEKAKRIYGLIVLGGVAGGVFGTTSLRIWIEQFSVAGWMWICFGIAVFIFLIAMAAGKIVNRNPPPELADEKSEEPEAKTKNPAIEGAKLVFRSRYLLSIVAIVGLYEITSQVFDFQFTATISHYLDGKAIGKQISTAYTIQNWVSMFVQIFLTGFIMTRFGVKTALIFLPITILLGSAGFLAMPILWVGSLLPTLDNSFNYSINQSSKEALYVPTTRDEKYKAKAFIDMFVQRFAKVLAVVVSLVITSIFVEFSSIRWLSVFTIGIVIVWLFAVRYAGNKFAEKTG